MLQRVQDAITQLRRHKTPVTYPAVARHASVSRTFLYENPDARTLVTEAITATTSKQRPGHTEHDPGQEASWQQRALNAETALKAAHTEIRAQRDRIAALMGQIRDTEQEQPTDSIQRVATENTTLKQRIRQLAQDNRTLEERLQAARSNARFADRRIAQLEAQLLDHPPRQP
jgi:chromosome segregation ATPase